MLPQSFHNFVKVTEVFLTQYTSRHEAKKNSHHLLPVKMGRESASNPISTSLRDNLSKSLIVLKKSLHSHLLVGCKLLTPYTTPSEAQHHQDERGPLPSSTLHPIGRGEEDFLQPLRETRRRRWEVKVSTRSIRPSSRPTLGVTCLQETSTPGHLTTSTPKPHVTP